jgi:UDP-N-acetylglucosamine--N-acetylmuramyl-(pentapeptide) pyrophosphoryl-undecaprenol N-acetylglucosamine transferase
LAHFGLEDHHPTLLITGGSLGAQRLNAAFASRVDSLRAHGIQVLHITGLGKEFVHDSTGVGPPYVVAGYVDRMDLAYAVADLVVARSGANTVCELTAVGLPAVYVPLPIGNGEQRFNAADVVAAGGGILVEDLSLTPQWVDQALVRLVCDGPRIAEMADAAAAVGEREADERLADLVAIAAGSRNTRRVPRHPTTFRRVRRTPMPPTGPTLVLTSPPRSLTPEVWVRSISSRSVARGCPVLPE